MIFVLVRVDFLAFGGEGKRCLRGSKNDRKGVADRAEGPCADLNREFECVGRKGGSISGKSEGRLWITELPYLSLSNKIIKKIKKIKNSKKRGYFKGEVDSLQLSRV